MYDSIKLENFRTFKKLNISGLKRVNLFVGKNNAGKTSILEAIELLSSDGGALLRISRRREENLIRHLFNGHRLEENSQFQISSQFEDKQYFLQCRIILNLNPQEFEKLFSLQIESSELGGKINIPLSSEGEFERGIFEHKILTMQKRMLPNNSTPIIFLESKGMDSSQLKKSWDSIVLTPKEEKVYEALQSITSDVERIAFTNELTSGIIVKLKNAGRVPLGVMGDGVRRLLGLAICLVNSENGYLLIDEIDTGLHYSTMEEMWSFVIQTANLFNIQVFATTHSWDCVRALAWLQRERPDLADSVTLHRVDIDELKTMRYSAEELEIAARHHIEVRG